jgi:hypothetical protein
MEEKLTIDNHVVCMVFNLYIEGYNMYSGENPWIKERLKMFNKYCVNAFANQTDPNFHLFLFCDKNTPSPYKQELLDLESKYKFITIIWDFEKALGNGLTREEQNNKILEYYLKVRSNNSDDIICSRFESDDIPEVRYNEVVKLAVDSTTNPIISLAKGLYWDLNTDQFLDSTFPQGPFVSVKSSLKNFISPYKVNHTKMITEEKGLPIPTQENLWIQLVHGDNIWNRLDRMPGKPIPKPPIDYLKTYFAYE